MNDKPEAVALKPCPSCDGLNISCPNGCGRDPKTGELNGTLYAHPPSQDASALVAAVRNLETAIDALAATRSHSTYLSMIDNDNAAQALLRLDGARQAARAALTAWEAQHG